ncbi:hypothetical protein RD1_C0003 (plasmid) [Roseobacter denitrificans OCh 114]|uniref:Uncharacterized protein n=1 Tax=Roseobacter denitrificans (strain ATCC 33942 / OCh 114) TaxID=375451 RepID=Q07GD1_ROSDO|nr:hypothetical protein RD1_C0003 [Roseobacter denitrificans OCh 114]
MRRAVIVKQPTCVRIAPDQETVLPLKLLQLLTVRKPGRTVAVARQPEIGIGPGGHAPVLKPEDSAHKHEGTEDQPLPAAFTRRLIEEGEDERGGHQRAEHRPEGHRSDQPSEHDGRENQPTEEAEQTPEDEHDTPHQEAPSSLGAGEGVSHSAKALRSCSRERLRISRSSIAVALESRSARSMSAPPRITLRRVSSLRCLVASLFFSACRRALAWA